MGAGLWSRGLDGGVDRHGELQMRWFGRRDCDWGVEVWRSRRLVRQGIPGTRGGLGDADAKRRLAATTARVHKVQNHGLVRDRHAAASVHEEFKGMLRITREK